MASESLIARLNDQIGHEFSAHQQYVAIAVYFDDETLPQLARFFYRQALEEREHAMMFIRYLMDADIPVTIPGAAQPKSGFADVVEPIRLALEQERTVTAQITELLGLARSENDFITDQFLQWFVKEQVEEVATMSDLLRVVERTRDDPMEIEHYVAREHGAGENEDPTAPPAAG